MLLPRPNRLPIIQVVCGSHAQRNKRHHSDQETEHERSVAGARISFPKRRLGQPWQAAPRAYFGDSFSVVVVVVDVSCLCFLCLVFTFVVSFVVVDMVSCEKAGTLNKKLAANRAVDSFFMVSLL